MTIPEAEPHVQALEAHLEAELSGLALVGVGEAPEGDPPLVVLYPDPGDVRAARLCGRRESITIHVMAHAIGTGWEQATWLGDKTRAAVFAGFAVEGRKVYRPAQTLEPPPLTRDDDINPPLYLQVTEYEIRSDPA